MRDDDEGKYDWSRVEPKDESGFYGVLVGIIVALALLAIAYLVFSANSETQAATTTSSITNIQPSKKNLGTSISQCIENDGICISKELVLSD